MKNIRLLFKYFAPYRWSAFRSILYNILSAIFALGTYSLVVPFLGILFNTVQRVEDPGAFQFTKDYILAFAQHYVSEIIDKNGQSSALMLVVVIVILASLFKNGFIFMANNSRWLSFGPVQFVILEEAFTIRF